MSHHNHGRPNRPQIYADGSTRPPKAHHELTNEEWDALLDDPSIQNFLTKLDPGYLALRHHELLLEVRHLRIYNRFLADRQTAIEEATARLWATMNPAPPPV